MQRIPVTTAQILLSAFNFNSQSLKLPDEYGPIISDQTKQLALSQHREPAQSVCVVDCYFIVNVLNSPFASPISICR